MYLINLKTKLITSKFKSGSDTEIFQQGCVSANGHIYGITSKAVLYIFSKDSALLLSMLTLTKPIETKGL
jgi:hypothetical protein